MQARKRKYTASAENTAPGEIKKIDDQIKVLETQLDRFAQEGGSKNYQANLSDEAPLQQVSFPPLPKNEKVLGAVTGASPKLIEKNEKGVTPVKNADGGYRGQAVISVSPSYPQTAKLAKVSGDVMVEFVISKTGKVISARCVEGHPLLQQAALSAASQWRFQPTILVERQKPTPVNVVGVLTFRFSN